jgi:hypothetical protein
LCNRPPPVDLTVDRLTASVDGELARRATSRLDLWALGVTACTGRAGERLDIDVT